MNASHLDAVIHVRAFAGAYPKVTAKVTAKAVVFCNIPTAIRATPSRVHCLPFNVGLGQLTLLRTRRTKLRWP